MSNSTFDIGEFIDSSKRMEKEPSKEAIPEELDVQKAVVEAFAVEKIELENQIKKLSTDIEIERKEKSELKNRLQQLAEELEEEKSKKRLIEEKYAAKEAECKEVLEKDQKIEIKLSDFEKTIELLEKEIGNKNVDCSGKVSLLDRNIELPDKFEGETRDFVLETIKEAYEVACKEGKERKAKILESVLVENEANGTLAAKREELKKIFQQNGNILSGAVIEYLNANSILFKKDNEFLLPKDIIKINY